MVRVQVQVVTPLFLLQLCVVLLVLLLLITGVVELVLSPV
jgi:hypothetical protein